MLGDSQRAESEAVIEMHGADYTEEQVSTPDAHFQDKAAVQSAVSQDERH